MKLADTPRMECHPGGRYALHFTGGRLSSLMAGAEITDARGRRRLTSGEGVWSCSSDPQLPLQMSTPLGDSLVLELTGERPAVGTGLLLTLRLHNRGTERIRVHRLLPLLLEQDAALSLSLPSTVQERRWGVYKQGYQSWSFAGWLPLDAPDLHPRFFLTRPVQSDPTWPRPQRGGFQSEGMLMLGCQGCGPVLLAGFVEGRRLLGRFSLAGAAPQETHAASVPIKSLLAWCEADAVALSPGESLAAEPLLVVIGPEQEALASYGQITGSLGSVRLPERAPTVWCSWYTHYTKVTETDLLEATIALQTRKATHPVDVIQLDDGYMTAVGDWLDQNSRFPHSLGWLANQIRQAGFIPGLWLAPFIALRKSRLFREHRDWFVKGVDGVPVPAAFSPDWGDSYYALDLTHPAVQEWLEHLIRQIVGLGFGYLKLDFLFAGATSGFRYDPQVPRGAALRGGLEIIRRAAGGSTFLLGCGVPMLPAVGLVDAMRIGPDTAATWNFRFKGLPVLQEEPGVPAARNALRNALTRQWMQRRLWLNDPDSQILRENNTILTPDEVRTSLLISTMTGGLLSFSDSPERLSPERLDWLRRAMPPAPPPLQPLTFLEEGIPTMISGWQGPWLMVLAVNGSDHPRPLRLKWSALGLDPQTVCHLYNSVEGEYLGTGAGEYDGGTLPPHGSKLLALRPTSDRPEATGSTFHYSPALAIAAEEEQEGELLLRLGEGARGHGQITLAVPPGYLVGKAHVEGANLLGQKSGPSHVVVLDLAAAPGALIRISYRRE